MTKRLRFTGRGRLLENGQMLNARDEFTVTDDRAEQLFDDPHVTVEFADNDGLAHLTRGELNELASTQGVNDPESLPNKQAVIDAITNPQAEADSGEGQSHQTHGPLED